MAFDYKKEYREFYLPPRQPELVRIPSMNFAAVRGEGDPNQEDGAYKEAIGLLYGVAFTIKMSKQGDRRIDGYFDYVVPPLEGFWWMDGDAGAPAGIDYSHKEDFHWISVIRLPEFVKKADFDWAAAEAARKNRPIFPRWNSGPTRRGCACSACTSALTTTSRRPSGGWTGSRRPTDC